MLVVRLLDIGRTMGTTDIGGWNGAKLVVVVDGVTSEYTLADGASGSFTHTVTSGRTMSFSFASGDYDEEVTYNIVYAALDGSDEQVALSDGPSPAVGEKILSICR